MKKLIVLLGVLSVGFCALPPIDSDSTITNAEWQALRQTIVSGNYDISTGIVTASAVKASGTITANKLVANGGNVVLNTGYLSGDGDSEGVYISANGNVGIGITVPTTKLAVSGTISASAMQVNGAGTFTGTASANKIVGQSLYSTTTLVENATTANVTIPGTQSIVMVNVDGSNAAMFAVKSTGGGQGCYTMSADTGDFAFGTTTNPGTAGKWNLWVVDSTTIAISDQNPAGGQNVRCTIFGN